MEGGEFIPVIMICSILAAIGAKLAETRIARRYSDALRNSGFDIESGLADDRVASIDIARELSRSRREHTPLIIITVSNEHHASAEIGAVLTDVCGVLSRAYRIAESAYLLIPPLGDREVANHLRATILQALPEGFTQCRVVVCDSDRHDADQLVRELAVSQVVLDVGEVPDVWNSVQS